METNAHELLNNLHIPRGIPTFPPSVGVLQQGSRRREPGREAAAGRQVGCGEVAGRDAAGGRWAVAIGALLAAAGLAMLGDVADLLCSAL
ncbi:hypothetical protein E3N88_06110 [Mikania micrantha]|uniref:Uncharacterized protein n=1 Tax=Mikania micrantha TaxID=192012 RepID=A0A5N6PMT9_9ASTR|nr:hypothetical protein E3N88_06110 [Mikania micrantha]